MKSIKVLQDYINSNNDFTITNVQRLRYSGGIMEIADIDDKFRVRLDSIWTGYWTKKWKEMSDDEFAEWVRPKIIKYINNLPHDENPSNYNIYDLSI